MEHYTIDDIDTLTQFQEYVKQSKFKLPTTFIKDGCYNIKFNDSEDFSIVLEKFTREERNAISAYIKELKTPTEGDSLERLIFGKDNTPNIVSCEIVNNTVELFQEINGVVSSKFIPNVFWMLAPSALDRGFTPLKGNLHYKYIKYYNNKQEWFVDKNKYKEHDVYLINDAKEAAMVLNGFTYFKNMKVSDVSACFFDLETTGLAHNDTSKVLLISNTYVNNGIVERKLFAYDEYETDAEMIDAWCSWVRDKNPTVLCGHNIFGYDLPYINYCAQKSGTSLALGRNESNIKFDNWESKFRKDGSQDYMYKRCHIYGREIVDTMFVAIHFDFSRKYDSYGLKQIIKQENLEVKDRVFYDASKIHQNYKNPEEWKKIKEYAIHDADDAKSLYELMISSYFYFNRSIPKTFQVMNYSATGSQLNSLLVRSYLQDGHSIPKADETQPFAGGLSEGNPGIYRNVFKVDCVSLYPSVILQNQIYDKDKDPNKNFLKMVEYFTKERIQNKKLGKETGERYYKDLEQSQKIGINSSFGLLGTKVNFNSPKNAALVTLGGREVLKKAILWCTGKEHVDKIVVEENTEIEE